MKTRCILSLATLFFFPSIHAQDSIRSEATGLVWEVYTEFFYSYDFGRPANSQRPSFLYNYNRHNEINLNLGYAKLSYNRERIRANVAFGAGTYMNANYAAEPATLQNLLEANAAIKLSPKKDIWLQVGIMPSHIGFESAVGKDTWTLTRSIVAENSPYFETGAKLGYTNKDGSWQLAILYLNGWQRITRRPGNNSPNLGTQIVFKSGENLTFNYSSFFGSDDPDSSKRFRTYHDLYVIVSLPKDLSLTAGMDIGTQQKTKGSNGVQTWWTPIAILRYKPGSKYAFAVRTEYFSDKNGVIIAGGMHGFLNWGSSFNVDYLPLPNLLLRAEYRLFRASEPIYESNDQMSAQNSAVTLSMALTLK